MRRLRLGLVVLGLLAAGVARGDTIFFDGELAASSFLVAEVDTNEGGTASTAPEPTGNPGSALRVQITLAPSAGPSRLLAAFFHRTAYDPMFDGGFASVDYDEDHRLLSGGGGGQATGVALRQNGSIFIHQVGTTPEREWTHASVTGLTVDDFDHVSGPQQVLNFSTGAPKIEVGFFRANSHSGAAGEGSQIVGIDNWRVALVPKCAVDADCDEGDACSASACVDQICRRTRTVCSDGDPCTVDACTQGVCSNLPLQCDDGASCTTDRCVAGTCLHDLTADPVAVQAKIGSFVSILERPPCSVEVPQFKLIKRLGKKLRQARAKIGKADLALAIPRITRLLGRASTLLAGARDALAKGETEGRVSPACANDLRAFLDDLRICVEGVPRQ